MRIKWEGQPKPATVPFEKLVSGLAYMESGYEREHDVVFLCTEDDTLVDMADGEVFEGTDFAEDVEFVEVVVYLVVEK